MKKEFTPTREQALDIIEDYEHCHGCCPLCAALVRTDDAILQCGYAAERAKKVLGR